MYRRQKRWVQRRSVQAYWVPLRQRADFLKEALCTIIIHLLLPLVDVITDFNLASSVYCASACRYDNVFFGYFCYTVPYAAWRRVAVTPPGRPTRRPGDATAYMTLTPWEPLQLRSPGAATADMTVEKGEEGKKKEAMNALDCRRSAGVLPLPI